MPDTKPAGCAGQFFGCGFAIIGAVLILGAIGLATEGQAGSDRAVYGFILGPLLLILGIVWYRRGQKPGQEAAAIRAAQAAAATRPVEATKRCAHCAEVILAAAHKCKHCGEAQTT